ncbi:YitT family protein [Aquibacillus rhizosphaerae]|uniref:YitT family protein n=1 Tax=Aquibacillus rhizosphaerae TaxID=3051431 RepID=A0ABT7LDC5_9BACI|nr:YitT family protein [Aquibacillus sp. LR5S19]MDL4843185.1 YitT family protein [Aquibacillus sp. LR5S19]
MRRLYSLIVILVGSLALGFAFNIFLLPHEVLSGGVTGLAMIFGLLSPVNSGIWFFLLNIPILIIGWMKLGKEFIGNSIFAVVITSISMQYIPVVAVTDDPLLSAVFGGVISGAAIGVIIRFYGSTGGFDVVGLLLTQKRDIPLGGLVFCLNSVVVFISGFIFSWDLALYTMASIYISGIVVDRVHTRHIKLNLMVVTNQGEELKNELINNLIRGITVMDGQGGYSNAERKVLYTVISRYELAIVKSLIKRVDQTAFVSVSETVEVIGNFRRE